MVVEPRVGMFRRLCGHRNAPAKESYIEAGHGGEAYETEDALEQHASVERANVLFTPGKLSSVREPAGTRRGGRDLGALLSHSRRLRLGRNSTDRSMGCRYRRYLILDEPASWSNCGLAFYDLTAEGDKEPSYRR